MLITVSNGYNEMVAPPSSLTDLSQKNPTNENKKKSFHGSSTSLKDEMVFQEVMLLPQFERIPPNFLD